MRGVGAVSAAEPGQQRVLLDVDAPADEGQRQQPHPCQAGPVRGGQADAGAVRTPSSCGPVTGHPSQAAGADA